MAKTKFDDANVGVTLVQLDGSGNIEVTLDTTIVEKQTHNVNDVTLLINGNNNVVTDLKYPASNKITLVPSMLNAGANENLSTDAQASVVDSGGNKYVFNGSTSYDSNRKFHLPTGSYIIRNVPEAHPLAILNSGNSNISYQPENTTPITIKVSGGAFSPTNGDYYTFTDANDNPIQVGDGTFLFMRGKKYRFQGNGVGSSHPFKIFSGGAFSAAIVDNEVVEVTIPLNQSTTAGDLYYQCDNHSAMKANMSLMQKAVTGSTNDGTYDFFYGDITVNVTGDFGTMSVYCYYHGYMGGENLFVYGPAGQQLQASDLSNVYFSYTKHSDTARNWDNGSGLVFSSFHYDVNVPKLLSKSYKLEENYSPIGIPITDTDLISSVGDFSNQNGAKTQRYHYKNRVYSR